MSFEFYQIDTFTDRLLGGSPAAVCPLKEWLSDSVLQAIAQENNLSETVFFKPNQDRYDIRWFTPKTEVSFGHAILAAAFVVFNYLDSKAKEIVFNHTEGPIKVTRENEFITLDLPAIKYELRDERMMLAQILGVVPKEVYRAREDYMVILQHEDQVRSFQPEFQLIEQLNSRGIAITAQGKSVDFVSRWFGPRVGVNEEFVTGSAHCMLTPYWARQLGRNLLEAEQLSSRHGKLRCELKGNRVLLTGQAMLYLRGEIFV